jgi:hypothetical protein
MGELNSNQEGSAQRPEGCRRTSARRQQEHLLCNLGPVLDLSHGGMRVLAGRRLSGDHDVVISSAEGDLALTARVVWSRRVGPRRFQIGLRFVDLDHEQTRWLARIAAAHARVFRVAS